MAKREEKLPIVPIVPVPLESSAGVYNGLTTEDLRWGSVEGDNVTRDNQSPTTNNNIPNTVEE